MTGAVVFGSSLFAGIGIRVFGEDYFQTGPNPLSSILIVYLPPVLGIIAAVTTYLSIRSQQKAYYRIETDESSL